MNFKVYDEIIKKHKYDIINSQFTKWDLLGVCYE